MKTAKALMSLFLIGNVPAVAADLPSTKSSSVTAAIPEWTGFYAGLNSGGMWGNNNSVNIKEYPVYYSSAIKSNPFFSTSIISGSLNNLKSNSSSGFIGGGQFGYNQQLNTSVIVGLEADIQGIAGNTSPSVTIQRFSFSYYSFAYGRNNTTSVNNVYSVSKSVDYLGTVRGRVGYLITPSLFAYATAGLAYGGTNLSTYVWRNHETGMADNIGPGSSNRSQILSGWAAGGGFEWMFLQNCSAKVEYIYYDLGAPTNYIGQNVFIWNGSLPIQGIQSGQVSLAHDFSAHTRFNGNIVRAGVNYRFNFASAPVVAKF
jgi:outer membrane immunogenic protein